MISPKMREILRLFTHPDQQLDRQTIVKNCGIRYYHNADKYIGDILGRMVKNGLLERVSPGVYKRGLEYKGRSAKAKGEIKDKNQLNLF